MKKIIFAFVTIITMMLCIASPLFIKPIKANAALPSFENEPQPILQDLWSEPINNEEYVYSYNKLLSYITTSYTIKNTAKYFSMTYKQKTTSSYDYQNMGFYYDSADVTIDGNHIVIENIVNGTIHSYCTYDNTDIYRYGLGKIDFDFDTFTFKFWDRQGETYYFRYLYQPSWPVTDIWNVYTNIDGIASSGSGLNLEVNFYPDLYGQVDRKIDGVTSEDFTIEIINHSLRTNAQCLMVICPTGQNVSFYDRTDYSQDSSISSVVSYNSLYTYLWWSDEWNYNYTSDIQTHFMHEHHPVASETFDVEKSLGPCPWHYVAADGIIRHSFAWSQINLEKFKSYTVYVYAMTLEDEVASRQAAFPTAPHFVDYDTIECVYSSEFTITNGYVYDMNNTAHGNYRSYGNGSSDSQMLGWSSKGTMDSNGNINIQSKTLQDYLDKHQEKMSNYTEAYIAPNWDGTPKVNVSSSGASTATTNYFDKFMRFVSYVFGRFPPSVQEIFIFGFVSVVVLGIILKVIK